MATASLPTSNVAGNNQTSPGAQISGVLPTTAGNPMLQSTPTAGTLPSSNPYMATAPTSSATPFANPNQANLNKQLVDILGKGVGGQEAQMFQGMSGTDSAIFQQWQAGQVPVQAQETAALNQQLGSMGVSGNSSVAGLANANLQAQFNAQAAAENAQLMTQNQQNQLSILQNNQQAAQAEVAASPWQVLGNVLQNVGADAATFLGGSGGSGLISHLFGGGGGGGASALVNAINPNRSLASVDLGALATPTIG